MTELLEQTCIKDAASLLHCVDDIRFTASFAIFSVTNNEQLATEERSLKAVETLKNILDLTTPKCQDALERAHLIMMKAKCIPRMTKERTLASALTFKDFGPIEKVNAMRLAGHKCEDTLSSRGHSGTRVKEFARCHGARMKEGGIAPLPNPRCPRPETHQLQQLQLPRSIEVIDVDDSATSHLSTMSPLSSSQNSRVSERSDASTVAPSVVSRHSSTASSRSGFARLTDLPVTRRTSKAAQDARAEEIAYKDACNSAVMAGSILLSEQRSGRLRIQKLNTAEKVALHLSVLIGFEAVTGEDLKRTIRKGLVGKRPPPRGPPGAVDREDFLLLCELVCATTSIDQVNCDPNRPDRPRMRSVISEIVNDSLESKGKPPTDAVRLCKRMEVELSRDLKLKSSNYREALRAAWLTHSNQKKNYEQWEWWCLDLGFARPPKDDEEREIHGDVVFEEEQRRRIIQFDEMGFSMDGQKNGKGGRPAATNANPLLPEPGEPTNHSSQKVTCLCGMNCAGEAIPPLFVLASASDEPRIRSRFLLNMKQVKGRFGFPSKEGDDLRAFSAHVAFSEDGSVVKGIMTHFIEHHLHDLYPDVEDKPGKRVLLKADLGPGRWCELFRTVARSLGIHFFPGVPNGTELGQEMDQLFSFLKQLMEENRERLWKARYELEFANAKTTTWDLPWSIFGGDVPLKNNSAITLRDAFNEALKPAKCERAFEKCGCIPATRVLLKSEKLVREICVDGNSVQDDSHTKIMTATERRNNEVVQELIGRGCNLAGSPKRKVRRVPEQRMRNVSDITVAPPCTKERQHSLMHNRKGGTWFKATNGGAPLNCNDAIIAIVKEDTDERRKTISKRKEAVKEREKTFNEAMRIIDEKGEICVPKPNKSCWTNSDLKTVVKWKAPDRKNLPTSKEGLLELWEEVKEIDPPPFDQWEQEDEDKLSRLVNNGDSGIHRTSMMRKAEARKRERLFLQLATLQQRGALKVVGSFVQTLSQEDREELFEDWDSCALDDDDDDDESSLSGGEEEADDIGGSNGSASWEMIAIQEENERSDDDSDRSEGANVVASRPPPPPPRRSRRKETQVMPTRRSTRERRRKKPFGT